MLKPLAHPRVAVLGLALLAVLSYFAAVATVATSAGASLTFTNCSPATVNYAFTLNGSGFTPNVQLEVAVQDNVFPGALDQPFFPVTDASGNFSLAVTTGSTQALPATATVYYVTGGQVTQPAAATATLTPEMLGSGCPLAGGGGGGGTGGGGGGPAGGPQTGDDCKYGNQPNAGWKQWTGAPFNFRNQGDCVSYVQHLKNAAKK